MHHRLPIAPLVGKVTYLLPLVPDEAERLLDGALAQLGLGGLAGNVPAAVTDNPRNAGALLHALRELGRDEAAGRVQAACDERLEPLWDRERGEFTWGCGLNEPHPRGQYNALLALGECGSHGAWTRFCTSPLPEDEPLVTGVEFPALALAEARWNDGALQLKLAPQNGAVRGRETSFNVEGLEDPLAWRVDGPASAEVRGDDFAIHTTIGDHRLVVRRG